MNKLINHTSAYFLLVILSFAIYPQSSIANVLTSISIPTSQQQLEFAQPVTLETVLGNLYRSNKIDEHHSFSLGFQLFASQKEQESIEFQVSVLEKLQYIAASNNKLSVSAELLLQQIKRWDVGFRVFTSLDWDLIRISSEHNPTLLGSYELLLPKRHERATFEGLVAIPQSISLQSAQSLQAYTKHINILSSANPSYAWVIYPDGHVKHAGYAAWNETPINLTPNSVVFFGFNSDEPSIQQLEKDIVKLITMRKAL